MKKYILFALIAVVLSGCTSTATYYDENGNITRIDKVTNFARVMDGTNNKNQMILVDGTFIGFEASATAGDNCTPGVNTKYVNGRIAFVNEKDSGSFTGANGVIKEFFDNKVSLGADGVKKE